VDNIDVNKNNNNMYEAIEHWKEYIKEKQLNNNK